MGTGIADGADSDCGDARELLRPAGKVQRPIELREGGLPEFWLREMEGVGTSFDEDGKPLFQRLRRLGKPCTEVFWFPLREAKNHREAGGDHRPDCLQNLDRKARAFDERRATVSVVAQVEMVVEELIDEVAVRAHQLYSVEAEPLGIRRCARDGVEGIGHISFAHRLTDALACH